MRARCRAGYCAHQGCSREREGCTHQISGRLVSERYSLPLFTSPPPPATLIRTLPSHLLAHCHSVILSSHPFPPSRALRIFHFCAYLYSCLVYRALGQMGRHTQAHARAIADEDGLRHLVACFNEATTPDLKKKAQIALKLIIQKCTHLPALDPLLRVWKCLRVVLCLAWFGWGW